MSQAPKPDENLDWLRGALQRLASISRMSDDDFAHYVFEDLDIDVRSCLHESNVDRLVATGVLSRAAKSEITSLRLKFLELVDSAYATKSLNLAGVRQDKGWLAVAVSSENILTEHVHTNQA